MLGIVPTGKLLSSFGLPKSVTMPAISGLQSSALLSIAVLSLLVASGHCWRDDEDFNTPPSDILLITMGGTRSHKIPFMVMAKGLIAK